MLIISSTRKSSRSKFSTEAENEFRGRLFSSFGGGKNSVIDVHRFFRFPLISEAISDERNDSDSDEIS